jgi:predicted GTPase
MRRMVIMGAGGRDFHDFNTVYRDDPHTRVVAFTAAQIPGIDDRRYPPSLAGLSYPDGIPIVPESTLTELVQREHVDEVVLAYSDLSHEDVMHKASIALAAGADFTLVGPGRSMLHSRKPVIAVCAARTGCGKSQTSRYVGKLLLDAGLKVALVRHPMPYGDLEKMRVQRFATLADIDASDPTVEEREEYEAPVEMGLIMYAGVDYADILHQAEDEADVVIWDGGNNDFPFFAPDVHITVVDPLRPGHEMAYHPGETNVRMADVVVVNKVDVATPPMVAKVVENVREANPDAVIVKAASPATLEPPTSLDWQRVLVVEDGPTITHGGMPFGACFTAAEYAGATTIVDPRPYLTGSLKQVFEKYPHIGSVLPAMGYGAAQLAELGEIVRSVPCDVVVLGTPMDLGRLVDLGHSVRRTSYRYEPVGTPSLASVLAPYIEKWTSVKE